MLTDQYNLLIHFAFLPVFFNSLKILCGIVIKNFFSYCWLCRKSKNTDYNIDIPIIQGIKKYRKESGLTQGVFVPTAPIIIRLAIALSISSDELLGINEIDTFFKTGTVDIKNEQKGGILWHSGRK